MYISNRHCPVSAKSAGVRIIGDDGSATIITFLRVELLIGAGVAPAGQALKVSTFMLGHDGESPYLCKDNKISVAVQTHVYSLGKINRLILRLAIPAILSNITVPLLGLCDTFISGHLGAERYLAAIAVGTMLVNSLYWLFGFLRMGTTGLTAEAFGQGDPGLSRRVFTSAFILAMALGATLMLLSPMLERLLLWIMDPDPATAALGGEYFRISILAAPAILATMTVTGWMIGWQNTLFPMITAISVNVINIVLSFSLVFGAGWGFYGVAWGTCAANWCGLAIAQMLARRLGRGRLWAPLHGLWRQMDMHRFFRVNSDLMMRSACIMAVLFAMTSLGGRLGDRTLAVNALLMQFFMFFSYFMDGFAFSGEALAGRFAGACQLRNLHGLLRGLTLWSAAMVVLFSSIYYFFLTPVAAMLTDVEGVVTDVGEMHAVVALIPVISAAAFILDGIYIGMTATWRLLLATLVAMVAFFFISLSGRHWLLLKPNEILWCGFLTFLLLRGALLIIELPGEIRRRMTKESGVQNQ